MKPGHSTFPSGGSNSDRQRPPMVNVHPDDERNVATIAIADIESTYEVC